STKKTPKVATSMKNAPKSTYKKVKNADKTPYTGNFLPGIQSDDILSGTSAAQNPISFRKNTAQKQRISPKISVHGKARTKKLEEKSKNEMRNTEISVIHFPPSPNHSSPISETNFSPSENVSYRTKTSCNTRLPEILPEINALKNVHPIPEFSANSVKRPSAESVSLQKKPKRVYRTSAAINNRQALPAEFLLSDSTETQKHSSSHSGGKSSSASVHFSQIMPHSEELFKGTPSFSSSSRSFTSRRGTFQNFVQGSSNNSALITAKNILAHPGMVPLVIFHGGTGIGKTHLLEAIHHEASQAGWDSVHVTATDFIAEFMEAIQGKTQKGQQEFRKRYRNAKILLIDDIQGLLRREGTCVEFLHTLDALIRTKKQIVLTSDRPLNELKQFGQDIYSRLSGGFWCPISPASPEVRQEIVNQITKDRGLDFPLDVRRKLAEISKGDAREISGLIFKIAITARASGRKIDITFLDEILSETGISSEKPIRLDEIKTTVCKFFGLEPSVLISGGRARVISQPRMLAMWLARKFTQKPLSEIGQCFGCSSHSTVISAQKKVESLCSSDATIQMREQTLNINDILRRIEQQLRSA
ncbi:MAG: DnaA/Hda family protein, partial [Planctomycetia bacterium]|nr:DnaA/Hda family protein [Planctomycetia bacterium]